MAFITDLKTGQAAEQLFVSTLSKNPNNTDFTYNTSTKLSELKKYDVSFSMAGKPIKAEIKHDLKAVETGNLAIEYMNLKGAKTGILSTQSDLYVFLVGEDFLVFITSDLKKLAFDASKKFKYVDNRAGNAALILIPISEAVKIAKVININRCIAA